MKTTRYLGNCQICEGDFKLHEGKMVHHGYKRPGDGYIHGDCVAVGQPPYEVSCEIIKSVIPQVKAQRDNQVKYLAKLENKEVLEISSIGYDRWTKRITTETFYVTTMDPYRWERLEESKITETKGRILSLESEIKRFEKRVADWKPMPIRTTEEEVQKAAAVKAERDARKAEERELRLIAAVISLRKRIDSADKRNKTSALIDFYLDAPSKLQDITGYGPHRISFETAMKRIDRDAVWTKLGFMPEGQYEVPPYRDRNAPFWTKIREMRDAAYKAEHA